MRVKVIRKFRDKHTKDLREIGDIFDATKERFEEINSASQKPFVKELKDKINFDSMTKKELVEYAKEKGIDLDMNKTKKEMIEELV